MTCPMEYHNVVKCPVQRRVPASLAVFGMMLLLLSSGTAQINGVPPSVTSPGFGGRAINGTPPSVTSLGRNGYAPPNAGVSFSSQFPHSGSHRRHHSASNNSYYYPYVYAVPVPYAVNADDSDTYDDDSDYLGGPTIFDRRGSGAASYVRPAYPGPAHAQREPSEDARPSADPAPESPQPATTLVFKDGYQVEVGNYAIVSQTLYDLAPGHPHKIALADLDIPATQKQNDDRGVTFQLPSSAQAD